MADSMLVRATKTLFYRGMRIKPGVTFTLDKPEDFSTTGMEWAPDAARDDVAAAVEASPKQRDPGGMTGKQKRPGMPGKASLTPDAGI